MSNSKKGTPKSVTVEAQALEGAKQFRVGEIVWMPFPTQIKVAVGYGLEDYTINTLRCGPDSFRDASLYKFGGIADKAGGTITTKDGGKREKTKAERKAQCDKRVSDIIANTYRAGARGPRGIPVPEDIAEMCRVVQRQLEFGSAWVDSFLSPFRAGAMDRKGCLNSLACTLAGNGLNKQPTKARVEKAKQWIIQQAEKNLKRPKLVWDAKDDDILTPTKPKRVTRKRVKVQATPEVVTEVVPVEVTPEEVTTEA